MSEERLLTAEEVARRLCLHVRTITNMAQRGEIPAMKIGRRWRFRASVIDDLYQERTQEKRP